MFRHLIAIVALAAPAFAAQANPLSSSYWEAAYLNSTLDSGTPPEDEVEGFRAQVSIGLVPYINFIGDYDQRRYASDRDAFYSAGLAGHTLDPVWQVFGAVTYELHEYDDNLGFANDMDEEGYGVTVGARATLDALELHAAYKYFDLGKATPTTDLTGARYGGGLALDLTTWWSLTADYTVRVNEYESTTASTESEWQEWSVGLRRYLATPADPRQRSGGILSGLFADD